MSEIKLLHCPICGKAVYIGTEDYNDQIEKVIVCDRCNLSFYGSYGTEEDLIKEWNTRKPVEWILERLEEARAECKELQRTTTDAYGYMKMKQGIDCAKDIVKEMCNV